VQAETAYKRELEKYHEQRNRRARGADSKAAADAKAKPLQPEGLYWTEWKKIEDWEAKFKKSATDKTEWNQVYRLLADLVKPP